MPEARLQRTRDAYRVFETEESRHIREHYIEPLSVARSRLIEQYANYLSREYVAAVFDHMTANVIEGDRH